MKPLDLAADDACRTLLEQHAYILSTLKKDPAALVSAATAHCAFLSAPKKSLPASSLSLRPYHLDPSFLWAPLEASCSIFKWARDAFVAQVAASTKAYAKLPDDCAGDILEFLQVAMTRTESLHVTEHCSSPKARDWVRAVFDAAMAVRLIQKFPLQKRLHFSLRELFKFCHVARFKSVVWAAPYSHLARHI